MNKKIVVICVLALLASFTLVGCGDSPKSLAKEAMSHTQVMRKAVEARDEKKVEALMVKSAELNKKIEKLSEKEMLVYIEEIKRLSAKENK